MYLFILILNLGLQLQPIEPSALDTTMNENL